MKLNNKRKIKMKMKIRKKNEIIIVKNKNENKKENEILKEQENKHKKEIIIENNQENDNKDELWDNIDSFIKMEEDPIGKYDYLKIDFTNCNYIFIVPEKFSNKFSSFYSNILDNCLIFFPKNTQEANELLDAYENEEGKKGDWIFISPCTQLENNMKIFQENKNIYCFIGYCPILNDDHDDFVNFGFSKYYGIADSSSELIEEFLILSNIIYYQKRFKYENDDNLQVFELKYNSNFLINITNNNSKIHVISEKLGKLMNFKINKNKCYLGIIQSIHLLNEYIGNKDCNSLILFFEKLRKIIVFSEDINENFLLAANFIKNLFLLYFYFLEYPYLYGVLTDEEINQVLSSFKSNPSNLELTFEIIFNFKVLINIVDTLSSKVEKNISILNEKDNLKILQKTLIENILLFGHIFKEHNAEELSKFYQIKYYFKDIDFCLGQILYYIIYQHCQNYPLNSQFINPYKSLGKRLLYYQMYQHHVKYQKLIDNDKENEAEIFNKSIKFNNTIIIGDLNFHNFIKKIKLPCENIYYLKENEIENFLKHPKKIKDKYNISKYYFIMNGKNGIEYLETIKYISNLLGIKIILIIYIENKNIKMDKKILELPILPTILTYSEKDIINYYIDNNDRLKDINLFCKEYYKRHDKYYNNNLNFPKLEQVNIIREEDNGWDMKKTIDLNIFKLVNVVSINYSVNPINNLREMYKVYKENNCLDLFLSYYGNYFGADYVVGQQTSFLTMAKMFIYAYTLEEKNGKSLYSIMNNDFRSGDSNKICRYLSKIKEIYEMIKAKFLKSYSGDVYRATYFKKELIDKIKPGEKMFNASLWSSSKKLSVAKYFLFEYKKNILLHTKIKEGNNIDIHLENLSQYPSEEEILFLPFCYFESFTKVKENNHEYYKLELNYCDEENKENKIDNVKFNNILFK